MIIKSFEVAKIDFKNKYFFLLYGQNEGHKKQIIDKEFRDSYDGGVYVYEESEILKNEVEFFNNILSKSFFEKKKLIIISRATDKIQVIIEELLLRKIDDLTLVLNAGALEKKSKLRSYFEKNKETICVPFYEDNNQTLNSIVSQFFKKKKFRFHNN